MADTRNPAFCGLEKLQKIENVEHIKHAISICKYAPVKALPGLTQKTPMEFLALDIETETREEKALRHCAMLLGTVDYDPKTRSKKQKELGYGYSYREADGVEGMIFYLAQLIDYAADHGKTFVYWKKFDAIHLLKLFLEYNGFVEDDVVTACERYQKSVRGRAKDGIWLSKPLVVCEIDYKGRPATVGMSVAVADCVQFFFYPQRLQEQGKRPIEVWGLDGSKHWLGSLAKEAKENNVKMYQKGEHDTHVIDWDRFRNGYDFDPDHDTANLQKDKYVLDVLRSNFMDCNAAKALQEKAQDNFYKAIGAYPRIMISPGSLANIAITKILEDNHEKNKSLNFYYQLANWETRGVTLEQMKSVYNMAIDCYSAGMIDILRLGSVENVGFADITSSYAATTKSLLNIENSTVTNKKAEEGKLIPWEEVPVPDENSYVMVTADCFINPNILHTLSVKAENFHGDEEDADKWEDKRGNVRPYGPFVASGMYEEFQFVIDQQMTSSRRGRRTAATHPINGVLEWVKIETTGEPSPLADVVDELFFKRKVFLRKKNTAEKAIKTILASIYGKTFECIRQYEDFEESIEFVGWRAGSYFNPVLATIITAYARLRLAEATLKVMENGGKPMVLMTDAIYWEGTPDQLPKEFDSILAHRKGLEKNGWADEKTLGLFDVPKQYYDGLFLKPGFYEFYDPKEEKYRVKAMGYFLNLTDQQKKIPYLRNKLQLAMELKYYNPEKMSEYFLMESRGIITPADVFESYKRHREGGKLFRTIYDLGRVLDNEPQEVYMGDLYPKRELQGDPSFKNLLNGVVETSPPYSGLFHAGMMSSFMSYDARLLTFRDMLNEEDVELTQSSKPQIGWNEQIKILAKQLGLKQKEARKVGLERMRAMLKEQGIKPLA